MKVTLFYGGNASRSSRHDECDIEDTDVPTHERRLLWIKGASLRQEFLSHWTNPDGTPMTAEEVYDEVWGKDLPAWSLHRLIEMMPCDVEISGIWVYANRSYEFKEKNNVYDNLIDLLTSIIKEGYFNKEYLEE